MPKKSKTDAPKKRFKPWRLVLVVIAFLIGGWFGIIHAVNGYDDAISEDSGHVQPAPVAIVFGAGLLNGRPSLVLKDRLDGAIQLYKSGRVRQLLMSGDNRRADYNEPAAMRTYALHEGVADEDIVLDYAGRDTYDTCYRARHVFGIAKAVLVTQRYHAPRALFTARGLGIDASALAMPDLDEFKGL